MMSSAPDSRPSGGLLCFWVAVSLVLLAATVESAIAQGFPESVNTRNQPDDDLVDTSFAGSEFWGEGPMEPAGKVACEVPNYVRAHYARNYRDVDPVPKSGYANQTLDAAGRYPGCISAMYRSGKPWGRVRPAAIASRIEEHAALVRGVLDVIREQMAQTNELLSPTQMAALRSTIVTQLYATSQAGASPWIDELCEHPEKPNSIVLIGREIRLFRVLASGEGRPSYRDGAAANCEDLGVAPGQTLSTLPPFEVDCPGDGALQENIGVVLSSMIPKIREYGETYWDGQIRWEDQRLFMRDAAQFLVNEANHCRIPPVAACLVEKSDYFVVNGFGVYPTGSTTLETAAEKIKYGEMMQDFDEDGIWNYQDNCPCEPNNNQEDDDQDGYGNACDEYTPQATDLADVVVSDVVLWEDGCSLPELPVAPACCSIQPTPAGCDVAACAAAAAEQARIEALRGEKEADEDGDDVFACEDNCPSVYNPEQVDLDGDRVGHACDCDDAVNDEATLAVNETVGTKTTLRTKELAIPGGARGAYCYETGPSENLWFIKYFLNEPPWDGSMAVPEAQTLIGNQEYGLQPGGRGLATCFRIGSTIGWSESFYGLDYRQCVPHPPLVLLPNGCAQDCVSPCNGERYDWVLSIGTGAAGVLDLDGTLGSEGDYLLPGSSEGAFCR